MRKGLQRNGLVRVWRGEAIAEGKIRGCKQMCTDCPQSLHEQDAAVAVIAPYAYGEKPEEVEVRLDDHRAPC